MPRETYPLNPDEGPLLPVSVGLPLADAQDRLAQGQPAPAPFQVPALVDTGSNVTCVSAHVIRLLGLRPTRAGTSQNVGGIVKVDLYTINLTLLTMTYADLLAFTDLAVMGLPYPLDAVEAIIGRDLLDQMHFHYDGPGGTFTLAD